jgi:hypothetical protein
MGTVKIDCDDCAVRGPGCQDCVVSVLLGVPETLLDDERRALEVLADVGLAPRLRLVPGSRNDIRLIGPSRTMSEAVLNLRLLLDKADAVS